MTIRILGSNREIQVSGAIFAEEDFLAILKGQLSPAGLANVAAAVTALMPDVTSAATQAALTAVNAAVPGITSNASSSASSSAIAAIPAAVTSALNAALPAAVASAVSTALASALAALPKTAGGVYTITSTDAAAGTFSIPTGLTTVTTALAQLFDATGLLQSPSLKYTLTGTSIVISKNGIIWTPVAGQKVNWIAAGT